MPPVTPPEVRAQIVELVREFVQRDVEPVAQRYDNEDIYPSELVDKMAASYILQGFLDYIKNAS